MISSSTKWMIFYFVFILEGPCMVHQSHKLPKFGYPYMYNMIYYMYISGISRLLYIQVLLNLLGMY